jgi:hypothetical protein
MQNSSNKRYAIATKLVLGETQQVSGMRKFPVRRWNMKKYLASLIPFLFCTLLAFIYGAKAPKECPDPSYLYQTEEALAYLSTAWYYIGIIMSGIFVSMFIINDIFDYVANAIKRKRFDKCSKER